MTIFRTLILSLSLAAFAACGGGSKKEAESAGGGDETTNPCNPCNPCGGDAPDEMGEGADETMGGDGMAGDNDDDAEEAMPDEETDAVDDM